MEKAPAGTERILVEQEMPQGIERRLVLRLLGHWRTLCGDRKMPAFSDLDPSTIPEMWPHSFVLEVDQTGEGQVFRALGDQIAKYSTETLVGMRVCDAPDNTLPAMALAYIDEVLEKGVPISRGGEFAKPDGTKVLFRSVLLPMSDDGTTICGILGAANCREVVEN